MSKWRLVAKMNIQWWALFSLNFLFAAGVMLTYLARRRHEDAVSFQRVRPDSSSRALVILPVKGVDYEFEKNLASLKDQDYNSYDLLAVVDTQDDGSIPFLKKQGIRYSVSSASCINCSGKVRAIYSAITEFSEFEYYVVADSDIRAKRTWLSGLILPLRDTTIGVSTTFPVFYPEGGYWSKLKMFWGLVGQSMMESNLTRFVWGGSMAFRRELMDDSALESFSRSISDDIAILRIVKNKGLKISYVPESKPTIYSNDDFWTFIEWSNRQTAFSIYSTNKTFIFGMVYYLVFIYLILSSVILSIFVNLLFLLFLFPFLYNSINSQINVPVKSRYFLSLTFILPFFYVWNLISGMLTKKITWRGTIYSLSKN
jgi:cellulose synthase/poly-beta-1,6-N-acetylglucosamine synthase-like glycosyltransferase